MNPENLIPYVSVPDLKEALRPLIEVMQKLHTVIEKVAKDLVEIIRKLCEMVDEYFASLFDSLRCELPCQSRRIIPEYPNPPNPPRRKIRFPKILEDGFFTKPMTREEFWAFCAHIIEIVSVLTWLLKFFN
ncbi:hypothetical protein [uncultured Dubosiella sp.]|uniref:hypothetical protein n=1 Tax=uncultured Dubosiella sp. TaxID=1937011 RepID=UPI002594BE7D|nr:hypothetical protein [uncultured Dubosiella sp.]